MAETETLPPSDSSDNRIRFKRSIHEAIPEVSSSRLIETRLSKKFALLSSLLSVLTFSGASFLNLTMSPMAFLSLKNDDLLVQFLVLVLFFGTVQIA